MIIDCRLCIRFRPELQENPDCADCVVTAIISLERPIQAKPTGDAVEPETERAISALSAGGILPPLRFHPVNFR